MNLVGVMIGMGLAAGTALVVATVSENSSRSIARVQGVGNSLAMRSELTLLMSIPGLCKSSLKRKVVTTQNGTQVESLLPFLFDPSNGNSVLTDVRIQGHEQSTLAVSQIKDGFKVSSLSFERLSDPVPVDNSKQSTLAKLQVTLVPSQNMGGLTRKVDIPLKLLTSTASGLQEVLECGNFTDNAMDAGSILPGWPDGVSCTVTRFDGDSNHPAIPPEIVRGLT